MKKIAVLIGLVIVLAVAVSPASAIIGGEEDYEHTNVGAIMMVWPQFGDITGRLCTATLIDPRVLVTAAHCYTYIENQGIGYDQVWVTFDQDPFAVGAIYLDVEAFIRHPDFKVGQDYHDIALVILKEPVPRRMKIEPETLPYMGYMDDVHTNLKGNDRREMKMIIVGYGATGLWPLPDLHLDAIRRVGAVTYQNLLPLEILTSNSGQDDATICYGDSGGPIFLVDQQGNELLVGIDSRSSGPTTCDDDDLGLTFKYRLDTISAQNFIIDNLPDN